MALSDKNAIMNIIGCLIQKPLLFAEIGNELNVDDFDTKFSKSIYNAIYNLFQLGAEKITIVDIDTYLQQYNAIYANFTAENGIGYLQDCCDIAQPENFTYYFTKVKKFYVLRNLIKNGISVDDIYPANDFDLKKQKEMLENFDSMSIQDIFNVIAKRISGIEYDFNIGKVQSVAADENIKTLKENLKRAPEVGAPLQGDLFNVIARGARKGKFYLYSAGTSGGKSRRMVGDACMLAYPFRYEEATKEWVKSGNEEKTLIITTELEKEEVQTIVLAYLSGVNEEKILTGTYTKEEEQQVDDAIDLMEAHPNLFIESIPDPTINQIRTVIKRQVTMNQVENVIYDYVFSSPSLLTEFRDSKIREDVVLTMLSTALKDLAVEYHLFVESATQISGDYENFEGIRNQTLIRGSKGIADKIDCGTIICVATDKDKAKLQYACHISGMPMPTHVMDIYKLRRGRYKNVRIWGLYDLGTARWQDLFVTDANYNVINIGSPRIIFSDDTIDFEAEKEIKQVTDAGVANNPQELTKIKGKKDSWNYGV